MLFRADLLIRFCVQIIFRRSVSLRQTRNSFHVHFARLCFRHNELFILLCVPECIFATTVNVHVYFRRNALSIFISGVGFSVTAAGYFNLRCVLVDFRLSFNKELTSVLMLKTKMV